MRVREIQPGPERLPQPAPAIPARDCLLQGFARQAGKALVELDESRGVIDGRCRDVACRADCTQELIEEPRCFLRFAGRLEGAHTRYSKRCQERPLAALAPEPERFLGTFRGR